MVTDKRRQGRLTSRTLQAATGGKTWRKVLLGGQSINCESIKKKKRLGNGHGAGGSLRPAVMMEKQEGPWKEVLFEGLW